MFDDTQAQVLPFRNETGREEAPARPETLRQSCVHPAEAWALKRRANRPVPPTGRLPVVAPVG